MWYLIVYDDSCYSIYDDKDELKRQVENLAHDGFFERKHYDIYQIKKVENFSKNLQKTLDKSNQMWYNINVIKVSGN